MSNYNQVLTDLKRKIFKPVYLLCGEEPYFIDQVCDYIEHNVLDESEREFNQTVLYAKDIDLSSVIGAAKRFPMMSEYQVVILKEAQSMKEFAGRAKKDDDSDDKQEDDDKDGLKVLNQYLNNPLSSTLLVICIKGKKLPKSKWVKTIEKIGVVLESQPLYESKLPEWITNYVKEKNYRINPRASQLLVEYIGNDLSRLVNELGKLFISIPEGQEITVEHIYDNIGISKEFNVFELNKALGEKDVLKANRIINYFASNPKDNPLVLTISTLFNYFNKLMIYHFVPNKGNKDELCKLMSIHPFFFNETVNAARNYPTAKLKNIFFYLREADNRSKGIDAGDMTYSDILKELVFKILH